VTRTTRRKPRNTRQRPDSPRAGSTLPSAGGGKSRTIALWAFMLSIPVVLFGGTELALQLAHYGPNLSLFATETIGGREYYIMNPDVKGRYFTRVAFTPTTSADYFPVRKPAGAFRVFCLGGSTTVGFPYGYAGSFPFLLRERLQRLFPGKTIEVINLGMTATNSFTTLDLASELPAYEPDLIIVYDGHNEFYGALGVASRESVGQARWLTRLYLKAIHSRMFLALRDLYTKLRGASSSVTAEPTGTMMERLARGQEIDFGSPSYLLALEIFRANIDDLVSLAQDHRIPLLLGTQVSNLRDLPPFVSHHAAGLTIEKIRACEVAVERGRRERRNEHQDAALSSFVEALAIDSANALIHFEIARSLDSLGRTSDALLHYMRARDLDCLRFRTSSDFNSVLLAAGRSPGVFTVDVEEAFRRVSPGGIIGTNLILEHVHPNEEGYFALARAYAGAMRDAGLLAPADEWTRRDSLQEERLWSDRTLTELDARAASRRIAALKSGWPFAPSSALPSRSPGGDPIGRIVEDLTAARTSWEEAHVAAAAYYRRNNDAPNLEREYRTLIRVLPANVSAYLLLGDLYIRTGNAAAAVGILRQSLAVEQTHFALNSLAAIAFKEGRPDTAMTYVRAALQYAPDQKARLQSGYLAANIAVRLGDTAAARQNLKQILQQDPGFSPAERLLNQLAGPN